MFLYLIIKENLYKWLLVFLWVFAPLSSSFAIILQTQVIDDKADYSRLLSMQFLEDEHHQFDINNIVKEYAWEPVGKEEFNKGFDESTWWLRARLENTDSDAKKRLIEVSYSALDYLDVYILSGHDKTKHFSLGDKHIFTDRAIQHRNFLIPIEVNPFETIDIYFKVKTQGSVLVPIKLWKEEQFHKNDQARSLVLGMYYGIMLVMAIYNLFIYFTVRDKVYLFYVLFTTVITLFVSSVSGFSFQYLWPLATSWNDRAISLYLSLTLFLGSIFTFHFLKLHQFGKSIIYIYRLIVFTSVVSVFLSIVMSYTLSIRVSSIAAIIIVNMGTIIGIVSWFKGSKSGRFFTISWGVLLFGGAVYGLSRWGIIPKTDRVDHLIEIGSAFQVLFLSFALAERINIEKRLRYIAQKKSLHNEIKLRRSQGEILENQRKTNELLEQRVKERTESYEKANVALMILSSTDKLTGLHNRRHLDENFEKEYTHSKKWEDSLAFVLIDIDNFKDFNDNYGHLVGDECLKLVADCITKNIQRPSDHCGRFGGEEFCIIMRHTKLNGAVAVAERIRKAIEQAVLTVGDSTLSVTASVGVVVFDGKEDISIKKIIQRADKALYISKDQGKNKVTVWTPDI